MKTITTTWTGIRPLIMHNGQTADPSNEYAKRMKELTKRKNKTEADYAALSRIEWEAGLYINENSELIMPSDNIERCIQLGAQKCKLGKAFAAAVFMVGDSVLVEHDGPKGLEKLYADPRFQIRKGVCVNQSRVIRTRPMVPTGWKVTFELEYDETVINHAKDILTAMVDAGALIGLGDWRPKFGRFTVEMA